MSQTWRRLTFLHWPYHPATVRRLLPPELEIDTFDNTAWVGLIPFEMCNIRGVPHFPETNLRTYVIGPDGSRAVWFFSLDADRLLAVIGARTGYRLNYCWASMSVSQDAGIVRYRSRRRWPHAQHPTSTIAVRPGERYAPNELTDRDHFFTARYRLYTILRGQLAWAQIEHEPWPLVRADAIEVHQTLTTAVGLPPPEGRPLALYSDKIDVNIGFTTRKL